MNFTVKNGQIEKQRTSALIIGSFESKKLANSLKKIDEKSKGYISNILRKGDFKGKANQTLLLYDIPNILAERILLVGLGPEKNFNENLFIQANQTAIKQLNSMGIKDAMSLIPEMKLKGRDAYWKVRFAAQAAQNSLYNFTEYLQDKKSKRVNLQKITFLIDTRKDVSTAEQATLHASAIENACSITKDLANQPPNICTPEFLAQTCKNLAKKSIKVSTAVLEEKELKALNMGALLAVGKGSQHRPKLISMQYQGGKKTEAPYVFVGKGITFDTGGHSLKPPASMVGMKYDMCGAATVVGVIQAAQELKLKINVVGIIPTAENTPGREAYRPDDILTSMSGTSIEVLNTDAEGRLILCDALTYAERFKPKSVIDIATLTGACVIALGDHASALYANQNSLAQALLQAGNACHDRAWQMPLWEEYSKQLESNIADLANVGGREAGSITAACFLWHFAKKYNWAHLDVAGTAAKMTGKNRGATGRPVPMLVQYLLNACAK